MTEFKNRRNPILPTQFHVPDCEAHVMPDGKVYIYGSFDGGKETYCSESYYVISSPDMENWTIHDEAFNGNQVPWCNNPEYKHYKGFDWSNPTPFIRKMQEDAAKQAAQNPPKPAPPRVGPPPKLLYAPDCIHKNGKYYLYFCTSDDQEGLAVSDRPEGPFKNPVQIKVGGIDPAIFVDDDGSSYYYWSQFRANAVKLHDDMATFDEKDIVEGIVTEEEHNFHEGSSVRKIGDKYYFVFADMERGKPNSLGYAIGDSPKGPFTYKGIIVSSEGCDPKSWNNHGSIECVNGQWYVFYHRSSRNTESFRRLCIEKIHINEDGTIDETPMTSQGVGEPFAPGETISGFRACLVEGGAYIDTITPDDWSKEWLVVPNDGCAAIFRYVKAPNGFKSAEICLSGEAHVIVELEGKVAGEGDAGPGTTIIPLSDSGDAAKTLKFIFTKTKDCRMISAVLK